ncbi:uncharacterized protein DUF421 [Gillisia sp. Hel_I_86]|uniref:DUF421 domain-containing protein n=1 Tax=Gillisia sp. Hel_I_86 TaxID=1249981 RepID=UPI00119B7682|nr:YetF domain-containing protein [Gillisia sp. Hel_I_86]TVZ26674.1 uncharacterized protein DUF421 [Gillisia sp. Hel_I_86]
MEKWFETSWTSVVAICISAIAIYFAVIIFTRLAGKRSFSKMSSFDFAMTVAIGSILASTLLSKSVSLLEGLVGLGMIYLLQIFVARLRRSSRIEKLIDNKPLLLMDGTKILHENLKKARVTKSDLRSKLREANVLELSQVRAVVFEATGDISVLHSKDENVELEDWLMEGILK